MLEKLLGLATIGSTFASVSLLHRFLSRLAIVLALTIISALMAGVLLIGMFYGLFCLLTAYGLTHATSLILVGMLVFILTAALVLVTLQQLRQIKSLQPSPFKQTFPSLSYIGSIAEAFMQGLSTHSKTERTKSERD
jgi:hypothetical protein